MLHMKTIDEIRYDNLRKLVIEFGGGDLTKMLEKSKSWHLQESENKLSRPTLDQILKKRTTARGTVKNVGDDLARKIEDEFRLTNGWMDNSHEARPAEMPSGISPTKIAELITVYCYTDQTGREGIEAAIEVAKSLLPSSTRDKLKNWG